MAGTGIYGELLKAQLENLSSDPGSTSVGRVYWNTTTQSPRVYTSSGWDDLGSAGSSSGRNYLSDWFDSYKVESVGTSAATSTGNRTVAGNTDPTKWVTSDLTNLTFARSADTTLRQSYNYLINSGDANADFVESPLFTLDGVDLGKPITVSFDCAGVSASDDYQLCAVRYDSSGTYQEVITIAGTASATSPYSARIPTGTTKFQGFFIAGSTASDQYAIRFMKHAVNVDLRIDSLYVGPEKVLQGAAITDPIAFTPESNLSTNVLLSGFYCRDGAYMVGEMSCEFTGANTQNVSMYLAIPTSIGTVDTTKTAYSQDGNSGNACLGLFNDDSGSVYQVMGHWSGNQLYCYVLNAASTYTTNAIINPSTNVPVTIADDDFISIKFRVPIVGWSSNVTMLDTANSEFVSNSSSTNTTDTTSFAYGAAGSLGLSSTPAGSSIYKVVRCQKPILPTTKFILEVSVDRTTWVEPGVYTGAMWVEKLRSDGTNAIGIGYRVDASSATDVQIVFGKYASASTTAWTGTWYWRLRVVHGDSLAGTPIGARNIVGDTTGTAVPSGYIGEIKEVTGTATPTTGSFSVSAALPLGAGVWDIRLMVVSINNAASTTSGLLASISSGTSTATVENINAYSYAQFGKDVSSTIGGSGFIEVPVSIASTTNYYAKFLSYGANYSSALSYRFYARRIA